MTDQTFDLNEAELIALTGELADEAERIIARHGLITLSVEEGGIAWFDSGEPGVTQSSGPLGQEIDQDDVDYVLDGIAKEMECRGYAAEEPLFEHGPRSVRVVTVGADELGSLLNAAVDTGADDSVIYRLAVRIIAHANAAGENPDEIGVQDVIYYADGRRGR